METDADRITWQAIKSISIDAVDTALAKLAEDQRGERLARQSFAVPPPGHPLVVPNTLNKKWVDHEYYVVPADMGDGTPGARQRVQLSGFSSSEVRLKLPEESRRALVGTPEITVFCTSTLEIKLMKSLRAALRTSPRGPLVEMLSAGEQTPLRPWSPPYLPPDQPLNTQQQLALAAMTTPGGFFIWGPPGTGKTKVITAAVRHHLAEGRSVLLSSHTHVAVDNVLEGLIEQSGGSSGTSFLTPGSVIRLASLQVQDKIAPQVRDHPHLLHDKAAAVLTNHVAEAERLAERRRLNRAAAPRQALLALLEELTEIDVDQVRAAYATLQITGQLDEEKEKEAILVQRQEAAEQRWEGALRELRAADRPSPSAEADLLYRVQRAERAGSDADAELLPVARGLQEQQLRRSGLVDEIRAHQDRIAHGSTRWWSWGRRKSRSRVEQLSGQLADVDRTIATAEQEWRIQQQRRQAATDEIRSAGRAQEDLERAKARYDHLLGLESDARASLEEYTADRRAADVEVARLVALSAAVPAATALIADMAARGIDTKLSDLDELTEQVDALDVELREVEQAKKRLDDLMGETQRKLVHEAPVVAATLASLTTNKQLLERRFDVVILDEVASAAAPSVVYAGSRADSTLVLVGDFLQNAPISEVDDPTTPAEVERTRWQRDDVFELFGIRDRATAERHPRCVALSRQYRYPSVVADLVNRFCYRGLLESHRASRPQDGTTIVLVDTYDHRRKNLERAGNSWWSPLGLDLLSHIVRAQRRGEESVGFVSPYRPQAERARARMRREDPRVQCGTSHAFQGREFDLVVFDLMQDGTARWVGEADLGGSRRQVSAAKLLNVGVTRAKDRLYLIGDWDFIQRSGMPGMAAISALAGHPNFEVIKAEALIGPA